MAMVLATILIILPAVSWFYLRDGLNWHKKAVAELGHYGQIPVHNLHSPNGTKANVLAGAVTVVHIFGNGVELTEDNKTIMNNVERLQQRFGRLSDGRMRPGFRLAMISSNEASEFKSRYQTMLSVDDPTWVWTHALGAWPSPITKGYEMYCQDQGVKPVKHYFALADTSGQLRRFYNALDEAELGRLVEHIPFLLPKD